MCADIQIFPGKNELISPFIKLTRSLNKKTGTATFLFFQPLLFHDLLMKKEEINQIWLIKDQKRIESEEIDILFESGKPLFLKAIFLLKSPEDWIEFLNFMNSYSQENDFFFELDTI